MARASTEKDLRDARSTTNATGFERSCVCSQFVSGLSSCKVESHPAAAPLYKCMCLSWLLCVCMSVRVCLCVWKIFHHSLWMPATAIKVCYVQNKEKHSAVLIKRAFSGRLSHIVHAVARSTCSDYRFCVCFLCCCCCCCFRCGVTHAPRPIYIYITYICTHSTSIQATDSIHCD